MLCLRHLSLISHQLLVTVTVWAAPAQIECSPSLLSWFLTQRFCWSLRWSQRKRRWSKRTQTNSRVHGLGCSTLRMCINYLQAVVQDKVNASWQLHEGQGVQNQKWSWAGFHVVKSQYSQLRPPAPPAVPALSAHVLQLQHLPQPILAPLDPGQRLSPADGHGGCSGYAGGIRLSCFIQCCLGQIPTIC